MVRLYDLALFRPLSCDYLACPLPPFSVDLLKVVGTSPLFDYPFIFVTVLPVTLAHKVGPGLQDLQT